MRALAAAAVLLASLAYAGAASGDRTNPSTEPACYRGVTYNVPFGHLGLFAFLATHPGATRGMCPAAAAAGPPAGRTRAPGSARRPTGRNRAARQQRLALRPQARRRHRRLRALPEGAVTIYLRKRKDSD